jgi:hypothetical protein
MNSFSGPFAGPHTTFSRGPEENLPEIQAPEEYFVVRDRQLYYITASRKLPLAIVVMQFGPFHSSGSWAIMLRRISFVLVCGIVLATSLFAQEAPKEKKTLKNADIVVMVQNHFDDETLLKIIEVSDTDFDISPDSLIAMKNEGVTPAVLRAMLQATSRKQHPAPAASAPVASGGESQGKPADAPTMNAAAPASGNSASNATSAPELPRSPSTGSVDPTALMQGMRINPQMLANLQSQMGMMNMGGMYGGMPSMGSYSPEQMPHVFLMVDNEKRTKQEVPPSMALMAQTKFDSGAPSAKGMALRSLATEALSFAAMSGGPGAMMAMSAFSMASGFMPGMRPGTPSMTYVWGLPGRKSSREMMNTDPIFELNYGDIPGVDPDAFEPVILQLVQTKDNYRLVGATKVKMDRKNMMSGNSPENGKWLSEVRWPTRIYKEERGFYVLRVDQPLEPGEYAVVLRPVKGYKTPPSGLGGHSQVFYSVWDFSVPGKTQEEINGNKKKK